MLNCLELIVRELQTMFGTLQHGNGGAKIRVELTSHLESPLCPNELEHSLFHLANAVYSSEEQQFAGWHQVTREEQSGTLHVTDQCQSRDGTSGGGRTHEITFQIFATNDDADY